MNIYVQYNQHLLLIIVNENLKIGALYGKILEEIGIHYGNVVYMIHNANVLGIHPYCFNKMTNYTDISNNSIIYLVLNHYPLVNELFSINSLQLKYHMWLTSQTSQIREQILIFDPIFSLRGTSIDNAINELFIDDDEELSLDVLTEGEFNLLPVQSFKDIKTLLKDIGSVPLFENCPITFEPFKDTDKVVRLLCNHYFSFEAIKSWLTENSSVCPYCKMSTKNS
jgi:hypothetical protein